MTQAQWTLSESPEAANDAREEDEAYREKAAAYEANPNKALEEKTNARKSLWYAPFVVDEETPDRAETWSDNTGEFTAYFENFYERGLIDSETLQILCDAEITNENYVSKLENLKFSENTKDPEAVKRQLIKSIEYLGDENRIQKMQEKLLQEHGEIFRSVAKNEDAQIEWVFESPHANDALRMLSSHIISENNHEPIQASEINAAFQMSGEVLAEKISHRVNSGKEQTIATALQTIQNENAASGDRFASMMTLHELLSLEQATKQSGRQQMQEWSDSDLGDMLELAGMSGEYQEASQAFNNAREQNDTLQIEITQREIQEILKAAEIKTKTPLGTFSTVLEIGGETPQGNIKEA